MAQELATIAHDHVMATLDFSHFYLKLDFDGARETFVAEIAALAPHAAHLHLHDSFGRQEDIWMYTEGERLAYGHGDLHMPVGWGDIPWQALMSECTFPSGVVFNIELNHRYWYAAEECVLPQKLSLVPHIPQVARLPHRTAVELMSGHTSRWGESCATRAAAVGAMPN